MFKRAKGCLYLELPSLDTSNCILPNGWKQKRQDRDGEHHHITILLSREFADVLSIELEINNVIPDDVDFHIIGLKICIDVAFLVVHYPAGDKFRQKLGLPEKDFHITIGFPNVDNHSVVKSIKCLNKENITDVSFVQKRTIPSKQLELMHHLHLLFPDDVIILLEFINALTMMKQFDDALSYSYLLLSVDCNAGAYSILKIKNYLKHYIDNDTKTLLWSMLNGNKSDSKFQTYILEQLNKNESVNNLFQMINDTYCKLQMPDNFSHVIENVYASAIVQPVHFDFLNSLGITCIIDLTHPSDNRPTGTINALKKLPIKYLNFSIVDRCAPTVNEMTKILDVINKECTIGKVIVHCIGGVGRTNLILACYLMKHHEMSLNGILEKLNNERKMILATPQRDFAKKFQTEFFL